MGSDALVRALISERSGGIEPNTCARRAHARLKEAHLGLDHTDLVPSLLNLGDVLVAALEFTPAIVVTERASPCRRQRPDPTASTSRERSLTWETPWAARGADDAVQTLERSLRLHEKDTR